MRETGAVYALVGQLWRYGIAGGGITLLGAAVYWLLAEPAGMAPLVALSVSFLICLAIGYFIHGRYSFRGHGGRDNVRRRTIWFVAVNCFAYALNWLWVYGLVERLEGPTWWPMVPMVTVTPLVSFVMHRRWTYG